VTAGLKVVRFLKKAYFKNPSSPIVDEADRSLSPLPVYEKIAGWF
jgi:hypothetical protein